MTLIIFSFTRFILQKHVIVLRVYISFLIWLFTAKNIFFFHLVYITKACDRTRYLYIIKKNVPVSYIILELLLCTNLCVK